MANKLTHLEKVERFWSYVEVTPYCWYWKGSINNCGYGQGKSVWANIIPAHRTAYTLDKGAIPQGMQLDHLCSNRKCVNPQHLESVTKRENARRMVERRGWVHGGKKYEPKYLIGVAAKPLPNLLKLGTCHKGHEVKTEADVLIYPQADGRVKYICKECKRSYRKNEKGRYTAKSNRKLKIKTEKPVQAVKRVDSPLPKSGYPHVYWDRPRKVWVGKLNVKGKTKYVGSATDPEECYKLVKAFKELESGGYTQS